MPAHKGQYGQGPIYLRGMLKLRESQNSLLYFWPGATDCHTHHQSPCSVFRREWKVQTPTKTDIYTHILVPLSLWTRRILYVLLYRNCRWSQSTKNKWHWGFYNKLAQLDYSRELSRNITIGVDPRDYRQMNVAVRVHRYDSDREVKLKYSVPSLFWGVNNILCRHHFKSPTRTF